MFSYPIVFQTIFINLLRITAQHIYTYTIVIPEYVLSRRVPITVALSLCTILNYDKEPRIWWNFMSSQIGCDTPHEMNIHGN